MSGGITAVLSGGGAKASAHTGAMRALLAAGLAPTRYIGTSMGAVVAAGFAAGLTPDEVAARLLALEPRDVFALDRTALLKGVFARGLLKPDRFRRTLERLLPVAAFTGLGLPLTVTAADLDTAELVCFGDGGEDAPLVDALLASCALPPYFPPVALNGRRLADGGLRAVVALEVAARFPADLVVAVDTGPGFDSEPGAGERPPPALLRTQGDAQFVLMASNTAAQRALWEATPGRPPLLWIRPRVRRGETFATDQVRHYLEEGERAARAALAARPP